MNACQKEIRIAITGVGAIIGQGILHGLRASGWKVFLIGVDRNERSPGAFMPDVFEKKPLISEASTEYLEFWKNLIQKHSVQLIVPGLEVDVFFLNEHRSLFETMGVKLALNSSLLIQQTGDKWVFGEWLAAKGYPFIPMCKPRAWDEAINTLGAPPLLLKPLRGNGSRGIIKIEDERDFLYWREKLNYEWMLQKIIGSDSDEYTVGVFGLGSGEIIGPILFRRRLSTAGNTQEAEVVVDHPPLRFIVESLCEELHPIGPTNLQFRIEGEVPYLLEINPRFSSSNSLRTAFGFNEAAMAIDFYFFGRRPGIPAIKPGIGWRYSEDFVRYAGNNF